MKKIIVVIIISLFGVFLITNKYYYKDNVDKEQPNKIKNDKNMLSLMLETDVGSGTYSVSSSSDWPNEEYIYNSELSKCENGSILSWNENKNVAIMKGNISDKCYLYFDKIDPNSPKPTNPTMAFDSTYNVVISGSTSRNGNVEYYYSLDNKSFTRGSSVTVSSTSTVYAYAVDTKNQKSDVVSKTVTIGTPQTGTVSTTYYCSKTNAYQSSSTCTYNYTGTRSSSPVCNSAMYPIYHNGKCGSRQIYNYSKSECGSWCSDVAYREKPASYACVQEGTGTESWSCYFYSAEDPFPYTCPNGGNLSGSTCIGATYSGSSRYKCSVSGKYYTTKSSATTGCTNYCANGSLYNSKCYYMS